MFCDAAQRVKIKAASPVCHNGKGRTERGSSEPVRRITRSGGGVQLPLSGQSRQGNKRSTRTLSARTRIGNRTIGETTLSSGRK